MVQTTMAETSPTKNAHKADLLASKSTEHLQHHDKRSKSFEVFEGSAEVTSYTLSAVGEPNTLEYRVFFHQGGQ